MRFSTALLGGLVLLVSTGMADACAGQQGDSWIDSAVAATVDDGSWMDDAGVDDDAGDVADYAAQIDDVSGRIDQLQDDIDAMRRETAESIAAISQSMQSSSLMLQQAAAAVSQVQATAGQASHSHECTCNCPTIDEIRQVVREELERVTVTLRSTDTGETKTVDLSVTEQATRPIVQSMTPGQWYVTAVDGVPVTPRAVRTGSGIAYSYTTPRHEIRTLSTGGRLFGAARSLRTVRSSGTCQMVNGQMVCN